jgi:hypothetical protein
VRSGQRVERRDTYIYSAFFPADKASLYIPTSFLDLLEELIDSFRKQITQLAGLRGQFEGVQVRLVRQCILKGITLQRPQTCLHHPHLIGLYRAMTSSHPVGKMDCHRMLKCLGIIFLGVNPSLGSERAETS